MQPKLRKDKPNQGSKSTPTNTSIYSVLSNNHHNNKKHKNCFRYCNESYPITNILKTYNSKPCNMILHLSVTMDKGLMIIVQCAQRKFHKISYQDTSMVIKLFDNGTWDISVNGMPCIYVTFLSIFISHWWSRCIKLMDIT